VPGKINIALAERELVCYAAPPKPDAEGHPKAVTGAEEREMETAIGVFASRDHAEKAVKELRERGVPEDSIVFLTRSETDAKTIAKEFGAYLGGFVGGAAGMTTGVVAASLLLPGVGTIFALGFGAAALLGLAGAGAGSAAASATTHDAEAPKPAEGERSEDVAFFREVLTEGRSLIVVRSKSAEVTKAACEVLDRLGLGSQERTQVKMQTNTRQVGDVTVVDIVGRITLGEGNVMLREIVREMAARGNNKMVLNLGEVQYVDSSGVGELVRTHTTIRNLDGQLRLANLNKRISDLLEMTRLSAVFNIEKDEDSAIRSLASDATTQAVA
jgi:anti-sigma B factor antagonist